MIESIKEELLLDLGIHNKKFIQELINQESKATPIDTGLSSSNWFVGKSTLKTLYKTPTIANAGPLQAQKRAQSKLDMLSDKLSTIYVINNVEYIEDLNAGTSPQAPAGYVDIGILNALNRYYPR